MMSYANPVSRMATLLLLAGCASTTSGPDSSGSDDCFYIRQINSWSAIDRKHLYVEGVGDDRFLLTMFGSCPGLQYTQVIALQDQMGRLCPNNFGRIVYRDGGMRQDCRIDNVERVASKEEAVKRVESRSDQP